MFVFLKTFPAQSSSQGKKWSVESKIYKSVLFFLELCNVIYVSITEKDL